MGPISHGKKIAARIASHLRLGSGAGDKGMVGAPGLRCATV